MVLGNGEGIVVIRILCKWGLKITSADDRTCDSEEKTSCEGGLYKRVNQGKRNCHRNIMKVSLERKQDVSLVTTPVYS